MSKINTGLYLLLGALIASIGFSLYIGPVLANSATPTVIGGATNGNIFGSIQFDEMNVTDTGVWRFDTGGGPILATATYAAVNPTLIYNSSVIITLPLTLFSATADGQGNTFNNIGNAGNDLGAVNTLVATSFSAEVNMTGNKLGDIGSIDKNALTSDLSLLAGGDGTNGGDIVLFTHKLNSITNREHFRMTGDVDTSTVTWSNAILDHNGQSTINVGAAGNDFGATNTLVATTFSGAVGIGGFDINDINIMKSSTTGFTTQTFTNDIVFATKAAGAAATTRLTISGNIATATATVASTTWDFGGNLVNNVGAAGNDFGASNTLVATTFSGTVDGGSQLFNNIGAAGNDFGATNTLVATTMSGFLNMTRNDILEVGNIFSDTDTAITIQGNHDNGNSLVFNAGRTAANAGQCIEITTNNNIDALTTRFILNCGLATVTATWSNVDFVLSDLSGAGDDYACLDTNGKLFRQNAAC